MGKLVGNPATTFLIQSRMEISGTYVIQIKDVVPRAEGSLHAVDHEAPDQPTHKSRDLDTLIAC